MKDVFSSFLSIQENRQIVIEFMTKEKSTSILEGKMQDTTESVRYAELRDFHYANILTTKLELMLLQSLFCISIQLFIK